MDCSTPGFPVHHQLLELAQIHVHRVSGAIHHLILSRPLLLLPSIFSSIRVFSNESALRIRWPKYWSFSFSIRPFNEYSELVPLGLVGLISLQLKGLMSSPTPQFKSINSLAFRHLYGPILTFKHYYWKNLSLD